MFTGLIQDIGRVESVESGGEGARLRIATGLGPDIALGDSVAVDGVCLTASAIDDGGFETEAMNQTLAVTALGGVEPGGRVNLELAMRASDRLGGHILQGHVDGVGEVASVEDDGFARRVRVALAPELLRYAVDKGSIALEWRQPHDRRAGRGLGRGLADPGDPGANQPRRARAGKQAERRVRHRGQVRGAVAGTIRWKGASVSHKTETESERMVTERGARARSRPSRRRSRRSAAAAWSSSATARTARTRATW